MRHEGAGSTQSSTPEKTATPRPKSMFAKLSPASLVKTSPEQDTTERGPEIPSKSPRRRNNKRFSLNLKPSAPVEETPRTPVTEDQDSFWRSPIRSPSLQRQGSLQTRRYNYEGTNDELLPTSPRRSIYSQNTPSRSSLNITKPLFLEKRAPSHNSQTSNASPCFHSPQLMQSPQLETQTSVWISEDKPEPKRSSFVGRSTSVRAVRDSQYTKQNHKKTSSHGNINVSQISAPQLMETTNQLAFNTALPLSLAAKPGKSQELDTTKRTCTTPPTVATNSSAVKPPQGTARTGPTTKPMPQLSVSRPSTSSNSNVKHSSAKSNAVPKKPTKESTKQKYFKPNMNSTPKSPHASKPPSSPSKSMSLIKRFFKLEKTPKAQDTPKRVSRPVATPISIPPMVPTTTPTTVDRHRKYCSATAIPARPNRQPDLDLLRQPSQVSLESSNGSSNSGGTQVTTPVAGKGHSPRIYGEAEWDYSIYQRPKSMVDERRADHRVSEWI